VPEQAVPRDRFFPEYADENGLVAIGGDLQPATLLRAYSRGIFPWFDERTPILWWSPDPRAIIELDQLHVPRRLARTIRSEKFQVTINRDFSRVIRECATGREEGTWITPAMIEAYERLHRMGHAHSVEAWYGRELAGGLYGVALGGFFAGESMATRIRDGSKACLVGLVGRLRERGFKLFDIQMRTEHTARMGAVEVPRQIYLKRLAEAVRLPVRFA
jgi:leucyl/phenylalanyl-tRNA--protein transferase